VALNREEKAAVVSEVSAQVARAGAIVMAEYRGLEVAAITGLRKQARESGVYLRVLSRRFANLKCGKLVHQRLFHGVSRSNCPHRCEASYGRTLEILVRSTINSAKIRSARQAVPAAVDRAYRKKLHFLPY